MLQLLPVHPVAAPQILVLHIPVSGHGLIADICFKHLPRCGKRLVSRAEKIDKIADDRFTDPGHAQRDLNIGIGDVVGRPWSRPHTMKVLFIFLQLLCLGVQRNPLVQGHLSKILFRQGVHDLRRRQAAHCA